MFPLMQLLDLVARLARLLCLDQAIQARRHREVLSVRSRRRGGGRH